MRIGGERFDIPRGPERFAERMARRFPRERAGIVRYLSTVEAIGRELEHEMDPHGLRAHLAWPARASHVLRWALPSAKAMIDAHVRDPLARAILSAQAGNHGLPPSRAPALLHAAVTQHYLHGGFYPRGGGAAIPLAFLRALRRAHGELRLEARVHRILVENGRAVGVALADGSELRARHVISNADPTVTYGELLRDQILSRGLRRKLARTTYSTSAISLFLATDLDLDALGLDSGNYWCYEHTDIDAVYRREAEDWTSDPSPIPGFFVTATTLKDRTKDRARGHTIEAFAFAGYDPFARWASAPHDARPAEYLALKRRLEARMIEAASTVVPGLREHVVFAELGTPLTNEHYVAATQGSLYGTEKTLAQVGPWAFRTRSEIAGLHLCGSSTVSHGVLGATLSGLAVAKDILGVTQPELLRSRGQTLRVVAADDPSGWPEELRRHIRAVPPRDEGEVAPRRATSP